MFVWPGRSARGATYDWHICQSILQNMAWCGFALNQHSTKCMLWPFRFLNTDLNIWVRHFMNRHGLFTLMWVLGSKNRKDLLGEMIWSVDRSLCCVPTLKWCTTDEHFSLSWASCKSTPCTEVSGSMTHSQKNKTTMRVSEWMALLINLNNQCIELKNVLVSSWFSIVISTKVCEMIFRYYLKVPGGSRISLAVNALRA